MEHLQGVPVVSIEEASGVLCCYARLATREQYEPLKCISFENASATVVLDVDTAQRLIGIEVVVPYPKVKIFGWLSSKRLRAIEVPKDEGLAPFSLGDVIVDDEAALSVTIAKVGDVYRIHCIDPSANLLTLKTINLAGVQLFVDPEHALQGFLIVL